MTTIPLPWLTPPLRANDRRSWQAQARAFQQAKSQARAAIHHAGVQPMGRAIATLTYQPKTKRRQDCDGIAPTLKACLDAAVATGILLDDDYLHVPSATCVIVPPQGDPGMWLELVAVAP